MNVFVKTIFALVFLGANFVALPAHATKMDEATHTLLINKFERSLSGTNKTIKHGVELRLADLYSDRARLRAMDDIKNNCNSCKDAKNDREQALKYYQRAFPYLHGKDQGRVLVQMAHLYDLNGESSHALTIYRQVVHKGHKSFTSEVIGASYYHLAEKSFQEGKFKSALFLFNKALKEEISNRPFIEYRKAWCYLNTGKTQEAVDSLVKILKSPKLSEDPTFQDDVSKDLATFIARTQVTPKKIEMLLSLSPDKDRKGNLYVLGTETDRLGKKRASLDVWHRYVGEGEVQGTEKLDVQIRVAQIQYDLGRYTQAQTDYAQAIADWKKDGCNDKDKCDGMKKRLRGFIITWNKADKTKPSLALLKTYQNYLDLFQDDTEMVQWAAVEARALSRHQDAINLFQKSALLAKQDLSKNPKDKKAKKIFEGSLLGQIEMAEATKNLKLREQAYQFYLENNPHGEKSFEARYQRANVWHQEGKYRQAFSEFHELALIPGKQHRDLKIKSADLALDSLASLKDNQTIQTRATEYAKYFPERRTEYYRIARKATLNIVASRLDNQKADKSDFKQGLNELNAVNLTGATDKEKIKYYKNRLLIATQAQDLGQIESAADHLLKIKSLSKSDREYALSQKAWSKELQLDFAGAYKITRRLKMRNLSKSDRALKLALLADLAGYNSKKHYEDYLKTVHNTRAANQVRVTLIQRSHRPWKELRHQLRFLKRTPDILANVTLETFARKHDAKQARHVLRVSRIEKYPAGQTLERNLNYKDYKHFKYVISHHHINGRSDALLKKTLKRRLNLLSQAEKRTKTAFRRHDWTMQVLMLNLMAKENQRLHDDLLKLPTPRRLNRQQRAQYRNLLTAQANGYQNKAARYATEWQSMWNESNSIELIRRTYDSASPALQGLLKKEIHILAKNAPSRAQSRLQEILSSGTHKPSRSEILEARRDLQTHPFDISKIQSYRELEKRAGRDTMVSYLDARMSAIQKRSTL